ncbi:hypothetical protein FRC12_009162 [Ceratobasidium sp. 428]|nr:hypothetical protein FRC12_009162 [Ceratobasidium sp. 428]
MLIELPEKPLTILDAKGRKILSFLPEYYTKNDQGIFTAELLDLHSRSLVRPKQADFNGRGDPASYVIREDPPGKKNEAYPWGCINFAAWVSLGHDSAETRISADWHGNTVQRFVDIQNHHHFVRFYTMKLNYALHNCYPESYKAHVRMKTNLQEKFPVVKTTTVNNPSVLAGTSYIYNRQTPLHTDAREGMRGVSPLVVMGDCTTGYLAIPRLRVKIPYRPGSLVFLRGKLLDHKVLGWEGEGNRICLAHFNHETEWKNAGVETVW